MALVRTASIVCRGMACATWATRVWWQQVRHMAQVSTSPVTSAPHKATQSPWIAASGAGSTTSRHRETETMLSPLQVSIVNLGELRAIWITMVMASFRSLSWRRFKGLSTTNRATGMWRSSRMKKMSWSDSTSCRPRSRMPLQNATRRGSLDQASIRPSQASQKNLDNSTNICSKRLKLRQVLDQQSQCSRICQSTTMTAKCFNLKKWLMRVQDLETLRWTQPRRITLPPRKITLLPRTITLPRRIMSHKSHPWAANFWMQYRSRRIKTED